MSMNRRRKQKFQAPLLNPSWIVPAEHEDAIISTPGGNDTYQASSKSNDPVEERKELADAVQKDGPAETGNTISVDSTSTGPESSTSFHADARAASNPSLDIPLVNKHEDEALDAGPASTKARRKKRYAVQHSTQWITDESDEPTPTPKGAESAPANATAATSHIDESTHGRPRQHGIFSRRAGQDSPGYDAPAIAPRVASNYTPTGLVVHGGGSLPISVLTPDCD